jgi:eukaryotic-like serine/threonine-protein kinase
MATNSPDVESIFCAAVDLATPEECEAYVQSACGENEELRERVEKLLAAHYRAGGSAGFFIRPRSAS